jgi:small subunit ribosomal protein S4
VRSRKPARIYGVLEKQFRGYYTEAHRRPGKTGENLLRILETRLDNVVYRAGFAASADMARQLVRHGHFVVNGHKVDIPSFRVSEHDIIEVRGKSVEMTPFVVARAQAGERTVPAWIEAIPTQMRILVHALPARQVIDTQVPGAADRRALLQELTTGMPGGWVTSHPAYRLSQGSWHGQRCAAPRESCPAASRGVI